MAYTTSPTCSVRRWCLHISCYLGRIPDFSELSFQFWKHEKITAFLLKRPNILFHIWYQILNFWCFRHFWYSYLDSYLHWRVNLLVCPSTTSSWCTVDLQYQSSLSENGWLLWRCRTLFPVQRAVTYWIAYAFQKPSRCRSNFLDVFPIVLSVCSSLHLVPG